MQLHVESKGHGGDLVLLHGWGMSGRCWEKVADGLSERYRVHLVDLPGHGSSFYFDCDWVDAVAKAFPFDVHVCGWSLGGQIALKWAMRHPESVKKLALVASTPCFVSNENWDHGMPADVFGGFSDALEKDDRATMKRFLYLQAQGDGEEKRIYRELLGCSAETDRDALKKGLGMLRSLDLRKEVGQLSLPALVIHGERDALVPIGAGKWLAENMKGARLDSVPECSHAPFLSSPGRFISRLAEFLDES